MTIIPLRQYNREIETLIDTGQLDEAVAHCRHILESFPKHIATYRLLGKAYLEQQRFGDAADIFQRVLSSVPDDHVANIGLSLIREDEGNLDAAIWYMERALEAQPSNSAIKDELRRLYGRRDGIEPPKVRLTRGALARMYSRGGLYDQAIAELRSALADDPQRPDLLVLLAQMYFHLGQQVEAVDTCGNIIKRLPYCLVANRILSSILPQTGRADDTKTYHQRVIAMDPYFASAPYNVLSADSVAESAINIERLAYRPGQAAGGPAQPAWAASLGIAFEENQADQLPDWLQDQSGLETASKPATQSVPAEPFSWETKAEEAASFDEPLSSEDAIPDWMKEVGWQPATGATVEQPTLPELEFPVEQPDGEIAKAEIPDWLRGLAPSEAMDEEPTSEPIVSEELDLPWLQKTTPGASDTIVNWLGAQKQTTQAPGETEKSTRPGTGLPGEEGGLPDWLQGVESSYGRSGITDWLKTSHVEDYEAKMEPAPEPPAPTEPVGEEPAIPFEELPEWLKEMGAPAAGLASEEQAAEEPALPAEGLPDWLKEMGESSKELAPVEAVSEEPALTADQLPEWLRGMGEPSAELAPIESEAEELALPADQLPDWLKGMGEPAVELAPIEPVVEEPALPADQLPEWLKEMGEPAAERITEDAVAEEPSLQIEKMPDWLDEFRKPAVEIAPGELDAEEPALPAEELPEWLKEMGEPAVELAPVQPVSEESALLADELPDWLEEFREPAVEIAPGELVAEEPALPAEDLPEWLKEMGEPAVELAPVEPIAEELVLSAEELPEWLIEIGEPAAELAPEELVAEEPAFPAEELHMGIEQISQTAEEIASVESEGEEEVSPFEDIPYWLKETAKITPAELSTLPVDLSAEESTLPEIMLPDWLLEIGRSVPPSAEAAPIESEAKAQAITGEEIPAEYHEAADLAAPVIEPAEDSGKESAVPAEELPEWLKEMGEPAGELPSPFREQSDQDAALAWLEALAAKQGVQEEELITKPEDRQETMPDWIRLEAEESQPKDLIPVPPTAQEEPAHPAEELPNWLREIAEPAAEAAPVEPASILPTPFMDQSDQDAALAWLEKLASQHGAREEEFITTPEERRETIPDWVKLGAEEALLEEQLPTLPAESGAPALPPEELPEWLMEIAEPAEVLPTEQIIAVEASLPAQEAAVPAEELSEWLKEMVAPAEALAPEQPIVLDTSLPAQEAAVPAEELPEWFKEMAAPAAEIAPVEQVGEIPAASIDLTDQDAALAWLEGLAAQHGAREEEMITRPEDRLEAMPDWIKQEAESSLAAEETPTQPVPVEAIVPAIPEVDEPVVQVEQLLEEPTQLDEPVSEPAPSEELVLPEVELPDWLAETAASLEAIDLGEEQADTELLPNWLLETTPPAPVLPGEESTGGMQKLPDWLKEIDQFAIDEAGAFPSAELPAAPAWMPEAILPETELPTPPAYVPTEQSAPEDVAAQLPETEPLRRELLVLDINTASLAQFEHLPGIGFVTAQNILAYRDENGPFGTIDDLAQVDGVEPVLVDDLRALLTTGIPEPEVTAEPEVETEAILFTNARHALAEGEVSHASNLYNRLVAQGADLEKVIVDMQDALYRHPLDINFWQILGDAYLRTDKLQEALDAYTEAEELLR